MVQENAIDEVGPSRTIVRQDSRPAAAEQYLLAADSERVPTISVVMPTLDEEGGIERCIAAVETALAELGLYGEVIVSDSSTDRTPALARAAGAIVVEPDGVGYGYAYRYGFGFARGEYVVMGDADTTYDFEQLPTLLEPLFRDEADLVLGSRFAGEIRPGAMPALHQYVGNPVLTRFLNVFYGAGVTDAHSGFRAFRRELLDVLDLGSNGMEFASEMVMDAAIKELRIVEEPIVYHERVGEEKLNSLRDGWRHVRFMLMNAPGYIFSLPAFVFLCLGVITMAVSLSGVAIGGVVFGTHTMIAGSLLTVVGYQVASLAIFSSVATRQIRRAQDPVTSWIRTKVSLEQGAALGVVLFSAGAIYVGGMLLRWVTSGFVGFEFIVWNMLAFTLLVVGAQTVFSAFFLSMLIEQRLPSEAVLTERNG